MNQLKEYTTNRTQAILFVRSQSAFLGVVNDLSDNYLVINYVIVVFQLCNPKSNGYFNIQYAKAITNKTKNIEKEISKPKLKKYLKN